MGLAGLPNTALLSSTSRVNTDPVPINVLSPMVIQSLIDVPGAIHTFFPIFVLPAIIVIAVTLVEAPIYTF